MAKQFLRQTPFGIFAITSSAIAFLLVASTQTVWDFAQTEQGLLFLTGSPVSILLLEIFLRKLERHPIKLKKASKQKKVISRSKPRPMGVDYPSASFNGLIITFAQNFSLNSIIKQNFNFKRLSL